MIYTIFFQQLFYGILALLLTYTVGKIITSYIKVNESFFFKLFITNIIGFTTVVLFYSILKAHGRTVNVLLLPIIGFLLYHFRTSFIKKPFLNLPEITKELLWSLIPFTLMFLYQSWFYFDFSAGEIKPLFGDFHRYAFFTQSLHLWGLESYLAEMNYFSPSFRSGIVPYHYPELWLTSLFSLLFQNSLVNSYYFTVYPLLAGTFILGIISLFETSKMPTYVLLIIALGLCFITDLTFSCYMETPNSLSIMGINGQKLAFVYCYLLLGFILLKRNKLLLGQITLIVIPLFSTIFLPGIWGGLLIYNVIALPFVDKKNVRISFSILIGILGVLFSYVLFLKAFQSPYTQDYALKKIMTSGIFTGFDGHFSFKTIKILGSNFIHYAIPNIALHGFSRLLLHIPFLLLFCKSVYKQKNLFFISLLFLNVGATATSLTKVLLDSNQFTHILGSVFVVLIIICIADFLMNYNGNRLGKFFILLASISLVCISWISPYNSRGFSDNSEDIQFIKNVSKTITNEVNVVLVFYPKDEIIRSNFYNWIWGNSMLSVSQLNPKTILYTIGNPEVYLPTIKQSYIDEYFYNHFNPLNRWKQLNNRNTLETFISHYSIKYFYVKANAEVPQYITQNAIVVIESPKTKNKFYKIK